MAGGWPIDPGIVNLNDQGSQTTTSKGTVLSAGATINTKGAYAQLVASTPFDTIGFYLQIGGAGGTGSSTAGYLVDIAFGASGSETVFLPNVPFNPGTAGSQTIFVPLAVPAGTRIAARCQSSAASVTITCSVILADATYDEDQSLCNAQNYGASTAASGGTVVDPGGTINTKGAWTQITAATSFDIAMLQIVFDSQIGTLAASSMLIDLGYGASGSEKVLVPNIMVTVAGSAIAEPAPPDMPIRIPSGTRLAMRAQSTNNTSGTRKIGATILGYGA